MENEKERKVTFFPGFLGLRSPVSENRITMGLKNDMWRDPQWSWSKDQTCMHQTAEQRWVCIFVPSFRYLYFSLSIFLSSSILHLCLGLLFSVQIIRVLRVKAQTPSMVKPKQSVPNTPFHHQNVKKRRKIQTKKY